MLGSGASISPVITVPHNTQARSFDGSDQDVNVDGLISAVAAVIKTDETEFSISLWCKLSASIGATVTLFKCRNTGSTNNQIILLYHASGNEFRFSPKFGGAADVCNGGTTNADGDSYEGDGIWHHIVGTVSVTDNTNELWIDGAKKESITGVGTLNEAINDVSLFQNGADGSYFDGDVKDVAIYGRQLTDAEIGVIYNTGGASGDKGLDLASGSHVSNTGLIAHFRFEEKSGTVAINEVGVRTYGSEKVTDGRFINGLDSWSNAGVTESGGVVTFDANASTDYIFQNISYTDDVLYSITLEGTGDAKIRVGYSGLAATQIAIGALPVTLNLFVDSTANRIQVYKNSGDEMLLTSVSIKEYSGTDGTYVNAPAIKTNIP